jgi:putative acetyltransferase
MNMVSVIIRETTESDLPRILQVEHDAFNSNKEANLTHALLLDEDAKPVLSLLAFVEGEPAGHILFTKVHITGSDVSAYILAPLAVVPKFQKQGIGGKLIAEGLKRLSGMGVALVFVLGHITYYPKSGFIPAHKHGLIPPYLIPKEVQDAWMVQELQPGIIGKVQGEVVCCEALNKPEHWRE